MQEYLTRILFPGWAIVLVAMAAALPLSIRAFSQPDSKTSIASGQATAAQDGATAGEACGSGGRRPCRQSRKTDGFDAGDAHAGGLLAIREWTSGGVALSGVWLAGERQ